MSVVTTILLTTSTMEGTEIDVDGRPVDVYPAIQHLNAWRGSEWLKPVHEHAGGNKYPQACVFMAAMNYFDLDDLKDVMRAAPWEEPESVVLLVSGEEDSGFHVEYWRGRGWVNR